MISINAPTSYFIYSSLSFFGSGRREGIGGTWFVRALEPLGRSPEVVRTELHRMVRDGELRRTKRGRRNFYRPTAVAQAEIDAGTRKIFQAPVDRWNGKWTMVIAQFTTVQRASRDRLGSLLQVEGFASLGNGVWIHPRPPSPGLTRSLADMKIRHAVRVLSGATLSAGNLDTGTLWKLDDLQDGYDAFIASYRNVRADLSDFGAFRLRFCVVFDYLEVAWRDPSLPSHLLPHGWSGRRAQRLAADLYRRLLPGAIAHGDALVAMDKA